MQQKAAQQLTYKNHMIVRLKSGKKYCIELEQWEWPSQVLMIFRLQIPGFVALRNHHYCHAIPPHTPVLTVSVAVLWVEQVEPSTISSDDGPELHIVNASSSANQEVMHRYNMVKRPQWMKKLQNISMCVLCKAYLSTNVKKKCFKITLMD